MPGGGGGAPPALHPGGGGGGMEAMIYVYRCRDCGEKRMNFCIVSRLGRIPYHRLTDLCAETGVTTATGSEESNGVQRSHPQ